MEKENLKAKLTSESSSTVQAFPVNQAETINVYSQVAPPPTVVVPMGPPVSPPAPCSCSTVCLFIFGALVVTTATTGLIWSMFWKAVMVLGSIAFATAVVGIFNSRFEGGFIRPLAFLSFSMALFFGIAAILTYVDYKDKCDEKKDLGDRPLQAAYKFDCEWGIILMWLWSIAVVLCVLMWIVFGVIATCLASRFDMYQTQLRMTTGMPFLPVMPRVPLTCFQLGNLFGVLLMVIGFVMLMVAMFHGHPTGHVDGVCPNGDDFFDKPKHNDLGCCLWTAKHGTCCHQSACTNKPDFEFWTNTTSFSEDDSRCRDLFGLLSCSTCHTNSGTFATSLSNITVCPSFCEELYNTCSAAYSTDIEFCESLGLIVAVADGENCFSGGAALAPLVSLLAVLFLSAFFTF